MTADPAFLVPHVLPNGLRVLCDPIPGLKTFALCVMVRGGSRWETLAETGWAHLLEHMVFKGAGGRNARELAEVIEAEGGQINAATAFESTRFEIRALDGLLPLCLSVLSDMMYRPTLDPDELEREKQVVGQEIAEAFDTPDDHVFELAQACAFAGQALGRPILGTPESVGRATSETLSAFRAGLYDPSRTVICVSGAVREDELLPLCHRYFAEPAPVPARAEPDPARFTRGEAVLARKIEQANLVFFLPGLARSSPDFYAMKLFAEILGGGMASRLFQKAREERGLAYTIDAFADLYEDTGTLGIFAGCAAHDAAPLAELVGHEIRALARDPLPAELNRAKAQFRTALHMGRESAASRAAQYAGQILNYGRTWSPEDSEAELNRVALDDLVRVGQGTLQPGLSVSAILGPRSALKAADAFPAALSRTV